MLGVLEKQMADPANHVDLEHSKHIAAEHEAMQAEIDRLMQRWEELMQAQEELEMQAKTDEYYMQLAIEEAKKAAERGEIPIGAVRFVAKR